MRTLVGGYSVMQQTKQDAEMGVTDEHRDGLAEYNEKIQAGETGSASGNAAAPTGASADRRKRQQHPGGMAPGAGGPTRSNRHSGRGTSTRRGRRRR